MESANLHHQHLQENLSLLGSSSSSSSSCLATTPSYYEVGMKHAWTQQPTTTTSTTPNLSHPSNSSFNCSNSINMIPDLGFQCWPPSNSNNNMMNRSNSSSIKEELSSSSSDSTFPKFTQMLTSPSTTTTSLNLDDDDVSYHFNIPTSLRKNDLLKIINPQDYHHHQFFNSRGQYFSQIYPSVNVSNLNQQQPISSCSSLDMNLQAMDLLDSSRFSSNHPEVANLDDTIGMYNREMRHDSFGLHEMQRSRGTNHHSLLPSHVANSKISGFENEMVEVKRPGSLIEPKATQAAAPKKSRLEPRTPCPPLKVRKEKLGDRIATLQQLVAPFGKTDTASVLMEAIGYIKFLQHQVETLSVPYMKSGRNNNKQTMLQTGLVDMNGSSSGDGERKRDLRSRGLCLVPLSCMSYVTAGIDAAGVAGSVNWPNHNYGHGGGT